MEAIPLLCKICPKQPHFSDVSHLLTHVASKGHLSHHRNAKIRRLEDPDVRRQLDEFDDWYERYGIERLESQRVVQKDARTRNAKAKAPKVAASKTSRVPRRPREKPPVLLERRIADSIEDVIDPRLSELQDPNTLPHSPRKSPPQGSPPPFDLTSLHRVQVARTGSWTQAALPHQTPQVRSDREKGGPAIKSDTDAEDVDWINSKSPANTSYPDPSDLTRSFPFESVATPALTSKPPKASTATPSNSSEHSLQTSESSTTYVTKPKGPQWPGMAAFDSASPNTQRLRNQKKDYSVLEQLKHNSTVVQPMERIYFPEGTLKKERLITGNVESSPLMEPTPKPKRRRQKNTRATLDELSTNAPRPKVRKTTKRAASGKTSGSVDRADPFTQSPTLARNPMAKAPGALHETQKYQDPSQWTLNKGLPEFENRRPFIVFRDSTETEPRKRSAPADEQSTMMDYPFFRLPEAHSTSHHYDGSFSQSSIVAPSVARPSRLAQGKGSSGNAGYGAWDHSLRNPRTISDAKENIEPLLDAHGRIDTEVPRAGTRRVTQRYFAATGNEPPRFFDTLPSQMEFGGLADHRTMWSSFNPLNPQYMQPHSQYPAVEGPFATPLSFRHDPRNTYSVVPKVEDRESSYHTATTAGT